MFRSAYIAAALLVAAAAARADEPLRDPMQPYRIVPGAPSVAGPAVPRYRLTAVLISPTRRIAVVNGKPYQQGERVADAEITRIDMEAVHLRAKGEEVVLHLGSAAARRAVREGESDP